MTWICIVALLLSADPAASASREDTARQLEPILRDPHTSGLLIFEVVPGSQCAKAGFQVGDVLTHYDGQPIASHSDLVRLARDAAQQQRNGILVLARRGGEELQAEFDAAPLGARLIPVKQGVGRTLWRQETDYLPDLKALNAAQSGQHRWELLSQIEQPVGWVHQYLTRHEGHYVLRVQSRIQTSQLDEERDCLVSFVPDKYLSVRSIHLAAKDRQILNVRFENGQLVGDRVGVPVSQPMSADVVSSYLGGLVAATMPLEPRACLRCSYLEAASLAPAPFADLYCHGREVIDLDSKQVPAFRFEQTVFGEFVAQYWIDADRNIVQTMYGPTIRGVPVSQNEVLRAFPNAGEGFPPIEILPPADGGIKAN